nr:unnamed protein product [Callosobruchus analis]
MYSGSDSNESQKYTQWPLSASAGNAGYAPSTGEQVDWAALAQQWIIMKEAGPPPPVPGEQPVLIDNKKDKGQDGGEEGGEAPMEVETDRGGDSAWQSAAAAANWQWPPTVSAQGTWAGAWDNASAWGAQAAAAVVPSAPQISSARTALLPTPDATAASRGYNSTTPSNTAGSIDGSSTTSNYWTANSAAPAAKHIRPHNKRYSKVNVPIKAPTPIPPALMNEPVRHHHRAPAPPDITSSTMPVLDANKRKQLPAWIREGLEKMEKEKMKQLEKEKQKQERDEFLEKNKQNDQETMEILKSTMKERQKSKFDSDEDDDDKGDRRRAGSPEPVPLTQDELMMKVRRTMTEILLKVTNSLIESVCKEERNRYLKKLKASDQRQSAPRGGVFLSARLGLGAYGDDSSSNSGDEEEDSDSKDDKDSDNELRDTIKKRMVDFEKTEREIEDRLEEAERQKAGSVSRSSTPDSNDNESQVDSTRLQEPRRASTDNNFSKMNQGNANNGDEFDSPDEKRQPSPAPSRSPSPSASFRSSSPSVVSVRSSETQKKSSRKKSPSYDSDSYEKKRKKQRKSKSRSRSRTKSKRRSRSKSKVRSNSRSRSRGRDKDYKRFGFPLFGKATKGWVFNVQIKLPVGYLLAQPPLTRSREEKKATPLRCCMVR